MVEREKIDLVIPTSDEDLKICSDARAALPCRVFLPRASVIERCCGIGLPGAAGVRVWQIMLR